MSNLYDIHIEPTLTLYWGVTLLSCSFAGLLLFWTITLLFCFFTELLWYFKRNCAVAGGTRTWFHITSWSYQQTHAYPARYLKCCPCRQDCYYGPLMPAFQNLFPSQPHSPPNLFAMVSTCIDHCWNTLLSAFSVNLKLMEHTQFPTTKQRCLT